MITGREEINMAKRLHRSKTDKWIAGVCGGVAEYLNVSSGLIRFLTVISGIGIVAYLVVAIIMPEE